MSRTSRRYNSLIVPPGPPPAPPRVDSPHARPLDRADKDSPHTSRRRRLPARDVPSDEAPARLGGPSETRSRPVITRDHTCLRCGHRERTGFVRRVLSVGFAPYAIFVACLWGLVRADAFSGRGRWTDA